MISFQIFIFIQCLSLAVDIHIIDKLEKREVYESQVIAHGKILGLQKMRKLVAYHLN